jgi:hypothetical protein
VTFEFRASSPSDADAIAELCERVLPVPPGSRVFARDHLRWKYWDAWPSWHGSRSFLLFASARLVAHAGIVPLSFVRDQRAYTLVQLIDWAADPAHIGAGAALLKRVAALADGAVSVRGSTMTQRMLKPLGFRSLGVTVRYAAPVIVGAGPHILLAWGWIGLAYVSIFLIGGGGRRMKESWQCPECRFYNSPATLVCPCGYNPAGPYLS